MDKVNVYQATENKVSPCTISKPEEKPERQKRMLPKKLDLDANTVDLDANMVKPWRCAECPSTFTVKSTLNTHMKRFHGNKEIFQCEQCPSSFTQKDYLKQHEKTHLGIKPFKCDQCEVSYSLKFTLEKHQVIHSGTKRFKCELCLIVRWIFRTMKNPILS